ncbi:c-5 sterol desaturase, partial [Ascosphaera pollenicola]
PKIKHAYATREKGVLWWSVLHGQLTSEKRRTRSVFARKSRQAVLDALEERGLDAQGRKKIVEEPVKQGEKDTREKPSAPSGIVGTLELYLQQPILEASQEEIKQQAGSIIDYILSGKALRSQETWRKPRKQGKETSSTDRPQTSNNRDHARRQKGPGGGEAWGR